MNKYEKIVLDKIEKYLPHIMFVAVTIVGFLVRYQLRTIVSGDAHMCLMPWYNEIAENGLYEQVGDYGLLYQFLIWVMTLVPAVPNLFAYKILSCVFDYVVAIAAALLVYRISEGDKKWHSVLVYSIILLCPTVFIDSSAWAQCDAIYTAFALLGFCCLEKEKPNWALVLLGISFSFKLHAVFALPFFLFYYFAKRRFSILRFAIVPAMIVATSLPLLFWGRSPFETFGIYAKQTSLWKSMANGYPSMWLLLFTEGNEAQYDYMAPIAILTTVCMLAIFMVTWVRKQYVVKGKNLLIMAFLLTYTTVFFLPAMHGRYSYLYEICAIALAVIIPKTIPLAAGQIVLSCCTYCSYLFYTPTNHKSLAWINIAIYLAYVLILSKELRDGFSQSTKTEELLLEDSQSSDNE